VPEEIKTYNRNGIMFIGEKGRLFVNHMGNFFECVASREEPVSPVRIQHRTISACHLTNISLRLGRKRTWNPEAEEIVGDDEADGWVRREQRAPYVVRA